MSRQQEAHCARRLQRAVKLRIKSYEGARGPIRGARFDPAGVYGVGERYQALQTGVVACQEK